jgi:hypothetical protein
MGASSLHSAIHQIAAPTLLILFRAPCLRYIYALPLCNFRINSREAADEDRYRILHGLKLQAPSHQSGG